MVNFDYIAPHYHWLETVAFGNALQRARVAWLRKIPEPRRVLIVGEGNGRFLCALLLRFPKIEIDCVDSSLSMLQLAQQRVLRELPSLEDRVRFVKDDLRVWQANESSYDLVVTHFVLDCFNDRELSPIMRTLARAVSPGGLWLLADFSISQGPLARLHARIWVGAMYLFFRMAAGISARRLISPTPFLQRNGFRRLYRRHWRAGLIKSEVWRKAV